MATQKKPIMIIGEGPTEFYYLNSLKDILHGHNEWTTAIVAFIVALLVGIGKEIRDSRENGNHFCVWDIVADIIGAVLGSGVAWLAAHFITRTL